MLCSEQRVDCTSEVFRTDVVSMLFLSFVLTIAAVAPPMASGQQFSIIHSFSGGQDGAYPYTGLTIDRSGNLYGTAYEGGYRGGNCTQNNRIGCGTLYELSNRGSGWSLSVLYLFQGGNDGASPLGRIIKGPNGSFYGTTQHGGGGSCYDQGFPGCGTVFNLQPPAGICRSISCFWRETVLHVFGNGQDGSIPQGDLVFDAAGDMYGTTFQGGPANCQSEPGLGCGIVYELTPSGRSWTENILYSFTGGQEDGSMPPAGVAIDAFGSLYGVTDIGGYYEYGVLYQLSPSSSGWIFNSLYEFQDGPGGYPEGGLILDQSGDIYGTTSAGGMNGGGTAFLVTPAGNWTYSTLYNFTGRSGYGPSDTLIMDAAGNLYGTTYGEGQYGLGAVFKLSFSGGGWTYTSLHDFGSAGGTDGAFPIGGLAMDGAGNLYGTTTLGGTYNLGTVFKVTP